MKNKIVTAEIVKKWRVVMAVNVLSNWYWNHQEQWANIGWTWIQKLRSSQSEEEE